LTEDLFAAAWARVDRADGLRQQMGQLWNDYISGHPFTPSLIGQGDGVYVLRVWENQSPPAELAVATGEWLYNVRSALDYVVWATAAHESGLIPPPDEAQLQYPIYDSEDTWNRNLYRLKHLAEHQIEAWSGSEFWRRINYSERFRLLQVFVAAEIATYEYDCTGASRKAELLTEAYREECDARRTALKRYPRRLSAPVVWSEPREARRSSRQRFDGTDFPPEGPGEADDHASRR
jgi:hypothetical protein